MSAALRRSVGSLQVPNYRRWFAGQLVSISGNWMQIVAEMWLVLTLTGSAFAVGLTTALQFLPMLLAGAWGGLVADSMSKRKLLLVTQALMAVPALALFALSATGDIAAWMVMALVLARGFVLAVDMPARQSFVIEIVGSDRVVNAVGLQSVLIHTSRITGPALAGLLIAGGGIELCFLLNALSFGAMILALRSLDIQELAPPKLATREPGAIRSALRYVTRTPELAIPLGMMALVGTLGFNFQVLLPLLARETFAGGATAYSALVVAMGAGAVAGALVTGARRQIGERLLVGAAVGFGAFALLAAAAPDAEPRRPRPGAAWRRQRHLRRGHQLDAAAGGRAAHARPSDGPLLDRLPRIDADRRADHGPPFGRARRTRGAGDGRGRCAHGRARRPVRLRPRLPVACHRSSGGGGGGFGWGERSR